MWNWLRLLKRHGIVTEATGANSRVGAVRNAQGEGAGPGATLPKPQEALPDPEMCHIIGRALSIRAIDGGSCNGCELELHALNNPYYNLEGVGFQFVASPRHADALLITGPLTRNLTTAVQLTVDATPHPRLVLAVGDCACNGGIFGAGSATQGALGAHFQPAACITGCPPHPEQMLDSLLQLVRELPPA